MFFFRYLFKNFVLTLELIRRGEWARIYNAIYARVYLRVYELIYLFKLPGLRSKSRPPKSTHLEVMTDHPIAFSSPDHIAPHGTKYNNSTNKKFVLFMNDFFRSRFPSEDLCFLDLGCSGGQLVKDFKDLNWIAVGLEGSDYSLKHKRANWKTLAGTNLFTCDITKPFRMKLDQQDLRFHLITAWEVMEHISSSDLDGLFDNIRRHLVEGGYFIASTSSAPSVVDGIELHQTRMTNAEWKEFIKRKYPDLEAANLGLKIHHYVRFDFGEPSFLVYRKKTAIEAGDRR